MYNNFSRFVILFQPYFFHKQITMSRVYCFTICAVMLFCSTSAQIPSHLPYTVQKTLEYRLANDMVSYNLARLVLYPKENDTFVECNSDFGEFNPLLVDLEEHHWTVLYMTPRTLRAESCVPKIYATDFYFYRSLDAGPLIRVDQVFYVRNETDLPGWSVNIRTNMFTTDERRLGADGHDSAAADNTVHKRNKTDD